MYKTVRQGENSLQYTILPQTEELLVGGGKGRDYSPILHVRRSRRAETAKGILIGFCIVMGMVALMVGSITLLCYYAAPRAKMTAAAERAATFVATVVGVTHDGSKSKKKELRLDNPTAEEETEIASTVSTSTPGRTRPAWSMPAFKLFWKSSPTPPTVPTLVEDREELNTQYGQIDGFGIVSINQVIIRPTVMTVEPTTTTKEITTTTTEPTTTERREIKSSSTTTTSTTTPAAVPHVITTPDVLITTKWSSIPVKPLPTEDLHRDDNSNYPLGKDVKKVKEEILDEDDEDVFKDLEDEEVFSKLDHKAKMERVRQYYIKQAQETLNKEEAHMPKIWPFEPSMTMFQWPEYSREDSMTVPLLVGTGTLLAAAMVLTAVVVRRRRERIRATQTTSPLVEEAHDDNTNLLNAESQEEE